VEDSEPQRRQELYLPFLQLAFSFEHLRHHVDSVWCMLKPQILSITGVDDIIHNNVQFSV